MRIIFHIGPHKTGTTAIQQFLQVNSEFLRDSGVYIPRPLSHDVGHQEIAWSLLGWDLGFIGYEGSDFSLDLYLQNTLSEAVAFRCDSIIFSSEDLSLLSLAQWKELLARIQLVAPKTDVVSFQIVSVYRDLDQYICSQYKTLVMLGLPQEFREVRSRLKEHFLETHTRIQALPDSIDSISEVINLSYQPKGLVLSFWNAVLPELETPAVALQEARFNPSYDDYIVELVRQGNQFSGLEFDNNHLLKWPTFHTPSSVAALAERRQKLASAHHSLLTERDSLLTERDSLLTERDSLLTERDSLLTERDSLLTERDSLLTERDSLLTSNSWKVTRPLRFIAKTFRSRNDL